DWEDVDVGDPLADLSIARLEMLWMCGQAAMHDFTRAYQQLMPHLDYSNLSAWDLFAALRPAGQFDEWATTWANSGRPDVTAAILREAHHWFVAQTLKRLT
ncbi:MAG: phosphotransferase family protein, partial [Anaerolineae bacterium]|nr:phosphotransferase family protein [Anaerolineae bacterium]